MPTVRAEVTNKQVEKGDMKHGKGLESETPVCTHV